MTPLAASLAARIAAGGPIGLDAYLAEAGAAYYAARDPFGPGGDFVTAPEVSQMFGELVGAWIGQAWLDQGAPGRVVLAELGPGRGTLMADALRALAALPGFLASAELWLVETSPVLRRAQAARLAAFRPHFAARLSELPAGPLFLVANEFFDALPIRQHRRADPGWQERRVGVADGRLAFDWGPLHVDPGLEARFPLTPDGVVVETCPAGEAVAAEVGARIAAAGGAALVVDYGEWDGTGDTLQAVSRHAPADPLAAPGEADLTAHVRFRALAEAARPARSLGPAAQGELLARLGIAARAERLARGRGAEVAARLAGDVRRLTDPTEMGTLFKALAIVPSGAGLPPGFADAPERP
ncbi:SAM-dependent methyltransferase [Amaricoccus sp.]|uniref:class I SAM-dependent methyltransferase n=1 Tax=Amaricoccus sp. TaxID=1872485 RepID=UPI001B71887F|nr:SAM-dependent methyltransferase [Amaricoccus sp.]MBP7003212.1 SAM-dependent methyltransferase [Amaricoccus sp.]